MKARSQGSFFACSLALAALGACSDDAPADDAAVVGDAEIGSDQSAPVDLAHAPFDVCCASA